MRFHCILFPVFLLCFGGGWAQIQINTGLNLARSTSDVIPVALQSSMRQNDFASLAIDGNLNRDFFKGKSCTHTSAGDNNPWWMLNLGSARRMSRVHISNRMDNNTGARFTGIEIRVYRHDEDPLDPGQGTVVATYNRGSNVEGFIKITFNPIVGNYLKIGFIARNVPNRYMHLCEVDVYEN